MRLSAPLTLLTVLLAALHAGTGRALAVSPDEAAAAAARVDPAHVKADVDALSAPDMQGRGTGTAGARKAMDLIARSFETTGLTRLPGEKSFIVSTGTDDSVVGLIPGSDRRGEAIVVSAHWDGVGLDEGGHVVPGADENASGLAALLELSRALARSRPRRTIVCAAFGGSWDKDDAKRFRGARAFLGLPPGVSPGAGEARAGAKLPGGLRPVLQVDLMTLGVPLMPSDPSRFFVLGSESSEAAVAIAKELVASTTELRLVRGSAELVERRGPRDDYDAFRAAGVPFLFLTSGVSRFYHKVGDVAATVDPRRVAAAARVAIQAVARADALDAAPTFAREPLRDEQADVKEVLALVDEALSPTAGLTMSASERRALEFKREKLRDMVGASELTKRDRAQLQESLELLLLVLTK